MEQEYKEKKPKKPRKITPRYLDNVAGYYLSRYSSSSANLKRILMRRAHKSCAFHETPLEDAEKLIDELVENYRNSGFLDDKNYAYNLARQLRQKGKSHRQIEQKMYEKLVPDNLSKTAMQLVDKELAMNCDIDIEILSAWRLVRRRRLGPFRKPEGRKDFWQKDLGSLARAGFSYEIAKQILEQESMPLDVEDALR